MKKKLFKRLIFGVLGLVLLAFGLSYMVALNFGFSTFDATTLVTQNLLHIKNMGDAALILHLFFLCTIIILIIFKKFKTKFFELIISLIVVIITTRVINFFNGHVLIQVASTDFVHNKNFHTIMIFILAFLLFNLGIFFMSKSDFFLTPYDKFNLELSKFIKKDIGITRWITDSLLFILAFLINILFNLDVAMLTIFTAIIVFGSGPIISIYARIWSLKFKN